MMKAMAVTLLALCVVHTASAQDAHIGEVRHFATETCPSDWAEANGDVVAVAEAPDLFAAIGDRFGGDGVATFGLPDAAAGALAINSCIYTGGGEASDRICCLRNNFDFFTTRAQCQEASGLVVHSMRCRSD